MPLRSILLVLVLPAVLAAQQYAVTDLALRADPADARVRPLESIPVQALYYGQVDDERVRLRQDGADWRLASDGAGWLSKPYRFQGQESEPFYQPPNKGLSSILLGAASSQFLHQDAVVYTAPAAPGSYEVIATYQGHEARLTITVDSSAPNAHPEESQVFPAEPASTHPYRSLAEHWAPFVAQETWFNPKSDYLARFDLDGDWDGSNNWDNAFIGSSQAYVYYAAMETQTHWFLIYNMFHPRDYSDKCIAGSCHENDNEGMILTIRKDGSRYGELQTMETLAHNNVYSHVTNRSIRSGLHNIDGGIELWEGSHPVVFIESGGHGVYGSRGSHSRYTLEGGEFTAGTGVTYVYKGAAERPEHPDDREVGYQLLPIYHHWWMRAHEGTGRQDGTFDAYYSYIPAGNRPRAPYGEIAGSFLGRAQSQNKAKPFWGWHDNRSRKRNAVATGQWALDPAYSVSQNLRMPGPFSMDYVYNPYLGVGNPGQQAMATGAPAPAAEPTPSPAVAAPQPAPEPQRATTGTPSGVSVMERHVEVLRKAGYEFGTP